MACPHIESSTFTKPSPSQSVYREDCTQCFDSIDDAAGLDVCLSCFNGGCSGDQRHGVFHSTTRHHPLALNIRRTRKIVVRDEPPAKMSKLTIAAETEVDRYDTALAVKCYACAIDALDVTHPKLAPIVEAIMAANTFSRKEEVKAWEQEMTTCEHVLMLQQPEPRRIASQDLGHCSECSLKENLWLCLECGSLGCGRAQFGGIGGNSHALAHAQQSGHGVAIKLGSITPEGTADVYCYTCDDERVDADLALHLANWGIILSEQHKTEKSLTEMQIEQNMRWEFSMTSGHGQELTPLFGRGLTGLKNLGNSCYMASIVQCLFDLPAFKTRYFDLVATSPLPDVLDPAEDLETQLRKMGHGLLSGRYSKPDADVALAGVTGSDSPQKPYQKGLAPSMLKHLIGRNHAEFSSMRQQDAFEFLQHLVKLVTRSSHSPPTQDPTQTMRFVMEQRLQCKACQKVRYSGSEQDAIFIDVPLEKEPGGAEGDQPQYKAVTLKECLDKLTAEEPVELKCGSCGSNDGFIKSQRFKTFPETLVINARKMTVVNWVPVKVDVPVIVGDEAFLLDDYLSTGQQPDEEALPDEESEAVAGGRDTAFVPNAEAFAQLEAMGFPQVRCEKALHATGNTDANVAMEWLFAHMDDPDIDAPVALAGPAPSASSAADPEKIAMLESMGFSGAKASKALRETDGDVERAVEWLFSHPDDRGDDAAAGEEEAGAEASKEDQVAAGDGNLPARFQLQSIVCHKGTSIHAGHYVAFIRKNLSGMHPAWVLYNDEKVVEATNVKEMKQFAYMYFFRRV